MESFKSLINVKRPDYIDRKYNYQNNVIVGRHTCKENQFPRSISKNHLSTNKQKGNVRGQYQQDLKAIVEKFKQLLEKLMKNRDDKNDRQILEKIEKNQFFRKSNRKKILEISAYLIRLKKQAYQKYKHVCSLSSGCLDCIRIQRKLKRVIKKMVVYKKEKGEKNIIKHLESNLNQSFVNIYKSVQGQSEQQNQFYSINIHTQNRNNNEQEERKESFKEKKEKQINNFNKQSESFINAQSELKKMETDMNSKKQNLSKKVKRISQIKRVEKPQNIFSEEEVSKQIQETDKIYQNEKNDKTIEKEVTQKSNYKRQNQRESVLIKRNSPFSINKSRKDADKRSNASSNFRKEKLLEQISKQQIQYSLSSESDQVIEENQQNQQNQRQSSQSQQKNMIKKQRKVLLKRKTDFDVTFDSNDQNDEMNRDKMKQKDIFFEQQKKSFVKQNQKLKFSRYQRERMVYNIIKSKILKTEQSLSDYQEQNQDKFQETQSQNKLSLNELEIPKFKRQGSRKSILFSKLKKFNENASISQIKGYVEKNILMNTIDNLSNHIPVKDAASYGQNKKEDTFMKKNTIVDKFFFSILKVKDIKRLLKQKFKNEEFINRSPFKQVYQFYIYLEYSLETFKSKLEKIQEKNFKNLSSQTKEIDNFVDSIELDNDCLGSLKTVSHFDQEDNHRQIQCSMKYYGIDVKRSNEQAGIIQVSEAFSYLKNLNELLQKSLKQIAIFDSK